MKKTVIYSLFGVLVLGMQSPLSAASYELGDDQNDETEMV
jgi:hypothetical protein